MLVTKVKLTLKPEKKEEDKETTVRYCRPNDEQLEHVNKEFNEHMKEYLMNNKDNPR